MVTTPPNKKKNFTAGNTRKFDVSFPFYAHVDASARGIIGSHLNVSSMYTYAYICPIET